MPNRITITTWSIPVRGLQLALPQSSARPSPAVGGTSLFVAAVGAIMWMHQMVGYAPLVLGAGAIGIAYTMVGWWRDVIHEAEVEGDHTRVVQISHRYGMILFIASEVM